MKKLLVLIAGLLLFTESEANTPSPEARKIAGSFSECDYYNETTGMKEPGRYVSDGRTVTTTTSNSSNNTDYSGSTDYSTSASASAGIKGFIPEGSISGSVSTTNHSGSSSSTNGQTTTVTVEERQKCVPMFR